MDSLTKAKNYCLLLLKYRLRSEQELFSRLKRKKFDEATIQEVLSFLKAKGFIDDTLFAKNWLESRIKKPLGLRKIEQELRLKGIDRALIESLISEAGSNYSELEVVKRICQDRLQRLKGMAPVVIKRRLYGYLLRRGFSHEVVTEVINSHAGLELE